MWHLPGTWWWNAKRSLTCCHVCVKQGNVYLCLICVSYCVCFRDRLHIHTWMHTVPATISSPDTRRHGNPLPPLSLLLFIYSFIYWLIDLCSFSTSWDSSAAFPCRNESSLGFDILRNVPRHFFERHSSSVRIANSVAVCELKAERRGWKKVPSIWREALFDGTRPTCLPGRAAASSVICELNNSRIQKKKEFNLFAKMLIISRTCGRVRLLVCFCFFVFSAATCIAYIVQSIALPSTVHYVIHAKTSCL